MEKNRLIAFGCSFTYGSGLPDCYHPKHGQGKHPSKQGWVALLSEKMNLEACNMAIPGSSNLQILYNILKFNFKSTDTVVVMWSMPNRDLYFKRYHPKKEYQLGLWKNSWLARRWMSTLDEHDLGVKTWIYMHHADLLLKSKNVKYLHIPSHPDEITDHKPKFINIDNIDLSGLVCVDHALDPHPGIESNKLTAEKIYQILCK